MIEFLFWFMIKSTVLLNFIYWKVTEICRGMSRWYLTYNGRLTGTVSVLCFWMKWRSKSIYSSHHQLSIICTTVTWVDRLCWASKERVDVKYSPLCSSGGEKGMSDPRTTSDAWCWLSIVFGPCAFQRPGTDVAWRLFRLLLRALCAGKAEELPIDK